MVDLPEHTVRSTEAFSYTELRQRVAAALEARHLEQTGGAPFLWKAALILSLTAGSYGALLWTLSQAQAWAWIPFLSLLFWTIVLQFAVMHDASHSSVSPRPWVNRLLAYSLSAVGCSALLWRHKHVDSHHMYTNVPGKDPDIASQGVFRFHAGDRWKPWHRLQHFYAPFFYGLLGLKWVWRDDMADLLRNVYGLPAGQRTLGWVEIAVSRIWHVFAFLLIPLWITSRPLLVLGGYLAFWLLLGVVVSIVFQLAHVTDVPAFPEELATGSKWAEHQIATTADFAAHSKTLNWLLGGLNCQAVHHLFPKLSHLHYPLVQPVIREYCERVGVKYLEFPSVKSALRAHFAHLRALAPRPA